MPFVGEIRIFAGNFAPVGWALCQGQLMPISENETLFNLIGTTYGGDGLETFALPDLQGRAPLHPGNTHMLAEKIGQETVTLNANNLPAHAHRVDGPVFIPTMGANPGGLLPASNNYPAITNGSKVYSTVKDTTNRLAPVQVLPSGSTTMMVVVPAGGNQPKENMQPYLVVNFIISLYGIFPSPT